MWIIQGNYTSCIWYEDAWASIRNENKTASENWLNTVRICSWQEYYRWNLVVRQFKILFVWFIVCQHDNGYTDVAARQNYWLRWLRMADVIQCASSLVGHFPIISTGDTTVSRQLLSLQRNNLYAYFNFKKNTKKLNTSALRTGEPDITPWQLCKCT